MNNDELMGLVNPGDQKVPVPVRHWDAMKRALWRSKVAWEIVLKEATNLIARCAHMEGCPAKPSLATDDKTIKATETSPCLPDCPDREMRMSALVVLNAARQLAPLGARKASEGPYYAPSREHFSDVIAELSACQVEIEKLDPDGSRRSLLRAHTTEGSTEPQPVTTLAATESSQLKE